MRSSLDRLWLVIAIGLPALVALLVPLPAVDLAYQVRAGDAILTTGALPSVDTYTFTVAGVPWTDQQWLAQVVLAAVHGLGGWELLVVLRAVLVAATCGLVVALARCRGAGPRTAAILSLVAFIVAAPALALRPQLLAIPVFAGMLVLVAARDRHPRVYLAAPLLVLLWANLHGSFVLAPLLLGYAWLDDIARHRPARRSLAVLAVGAAATVLTPFGPGVWAYAARIGANPEIVGRVSEWQRTSPLTVPGALFYLAAAGAAIVAWRYRHRLSRADGLWLVGLTALGAWAERGVAWWPAGMVLVVASALAPPVRGPVETLAGVALAGEAPPAASPGTGARRPARRPAGPRRLVAATVVALALALVAALPWWRPADPLTGRAGLLSYAPSGLAQALRGRVAAGTCVFVPQTWGSWFEWAVPEARYLVDSRFELFPADVWAVDDVISDGGSAAAEALDLRGVEVVVLPVSWTPPSGPWTTVYSDADGVIMVLAPTR